MRALSARERGKARIALTYRHTRDFAAAYGALLPPAAREIIDRYLALEHRPKPAPRMGHASGRIPHAKPGNPGWTDFLLLKGRNIPMLTMERAKELNDAMVTEPHLRVHALSVSAAMRAMARPLWRGRRALGRHRLPARLRL